MKKELTKRDGPDSEIDHGKLHETAKKEEERQEAVQAKPFFARHTPQHPRQTGTVEHLAVGVE